MGTEHLAGCRGTSKELYYIPEPCGPDDKSLSQKSPRVTTQQGVWSIDDIIEIRLGCGHVCMCHRLTNTGDASTTWFLELETG